LEGIVAGRGRVSDLVTKDERPGNRSEQEIAGYRDALALIHESAEHIPFSVNVIRQFHTQVYSYLPQEGGRWKPTQNEIVERDVEGNVTRVRFQPVSPVATPQAMADLESTYRRTVNVDAIDELIVIPLAVLDFLCIHPFLDGNGRVGRLLTLLLLYHFGYEVGELTELARGQPRSLSLDDLLLGGADSSFRRVRGSRRRDSDRSGFKNASDPRCSESESWTVCHLRNSVRLSGYQPTDDSGCARTVA
jgi:Fic family protein